MTDKRQDVPPAEKDPVGVWMWLLAVVVCSGIWGGLKTGCAKGLLKGGVKEIAVAQHSLSSQQSLATTWTTQDRSKLFQDSASAMRRNKLFSNFTEEERLQMAECTTTKTTTAIPGGQAEAASLWDAGLSDLLVRVDKECVEEAKVRFSTSRTWGPSVGFLISYSCVAGNGDQVQSYCDCLARLASAQFASPADFFPVFTGTGASAEDRKRFDRLIRDCRDNPAKVLEGLITVRYPSGQKSSEGTFKRGLAQGLGTWWYPNGKKKSETTFKNGEPDGLSTEWNENGKKKSDTNFKFGKLNGLRTEWDDGGRETSQVLYRAGKFVTQ